MLALDVDSFLEIVKILPATVGLLARTCRGMSALMKHVLAAVSGNARVIKRDSNPRVPCEELWALDISRFKVVNEQHILHGITKSQYVIIGDIKTTEINFTCGIAFGQWKETITPLPMRANTEPYYVKTGYFGIRSIPHELVFVRKYSPEGGLTSIKMRLVGKGWKSDVYNCDKLTTVLTVRPRRGNLAVISGHRNVKLPVTIQSITDEYLAVDHPPIPFGLKSEWEMLPGCVRDLMELAPKYLHSSDGESLQDLIEFWSYDDWSDDDSDY